jgi:hypothetical protein
MEKPTTWPEYAPTLTSGRDEIVLLELANPIKPLVGLDFAKPAGDALPKLGELLLTSGFGEDDDGNCPKGAPPLAVMRYFGERRDGRGSGYRDPRILWNGIARKFDSGAPVFFPDISTFDPIVRLIGIHSCRTAAGDNDVVPATEEVAEFLRITPLMERWIASKIRTIVSGDNSSTSSTTTTSSFVLREAFNCVLLESDDALVNKAGCEWCLEDVFSTRGFLQPCDALIISYDASTKQRSMTIVRNKKTVLGPLPLSLDGIAPDNNHWLYAAQKDVAGHLIAEYYVFQRTNSADNKTCRVRVEVFAVDGVSTKPGVKNIRTGDAAPEMSEDYTGCVSVAADSGVALADTDPGDQDDQGNGYERKRQS